MNSIDTVSGREPEALAPQPERDADLLRQLQGERERRLELERLVNELAPKALFADAVKASPNAILIGNLAKLLKQNGVEIGRNRLFELLREKGYLCRGDGDHNFPTQKSMEMGLFEVQEQAVTSPDGGARIVRTTMVTGKGQIFFINKFKDGGILY